MSSGYRSVLGLMVLAALVPGTWAAAIAGPMEATISLGRDRPKQWGRIKGMFE